uniref:Odorant receptor 49a n=1 Tax=Drosophila melanogaster TaxID=7227 RepID=OR49A_DROME|nr:odorant receptor 49a [Drosophila melanogaster]Q9V6A9.3 RecName: Full=Odorant receptor 49a [Drosophila melanogaster]AAF58519.3 odorant receptor 49a [Drosophila melanogaster]|eukprot:NP_523711.3 odorant receptor 49a [Drosophila melanogaster]
MEKLRSYEDFIFMANMMFKTLGYDLFHTPKPWWRYLLVRGYFVLCTISNFYEASMVTTRIIEWESLAGSPSKIMRQGLHFFYMLSSQLKFITFMINRKRLLQLSHRLKELYPHKEQNQRKYEVNKYYLSCSTRNVLYVYYFVMVVMALEPLVQSCIMYLIGFGKADFTYKRIFPTRLTFDSEKPLGYVLAYVIDFTYSQFIVNVSLGTDLWMMCVSSQISMHLGYLANMLASIRPSPETEQQDCDFLASIIKRHQLMIRLQKDVNYVFGLLLASNLFTTSCLLCCMAYYTVVEGFNWEGISYMMLFASVAAQFYVVSSHGQMLIDLSTNLAKAAFESKWYEGSLRYKKEILILMAQAQRPLEISARGVIIISLDTFKILMTITYRFFAVIRQTVEK